MKTQEHQNTAKDKSKLQSNSAQTEPDLCQTDTVRMDPTDQAQDMSILHLRGFLLKSNSTDVPCFLCVIRVGSDEC